MIVTVMNDKFNACIRTINITWDDFVAMCLCPGCMDYKGNGAIVGGLCVWETEISYSTHNRHKIFEHKNRRCINRQLVILDADNPQDDFLDRTQSYFAKLDAAWVYYTTFSATKDNPRYRICTYLDKPVSPQSYETIAKSIMYGIGFEEFDPVSSNANQIMYLAVMPIKINPESGEEEIFFCRDSFDGNPIDTNRLMDNITTVSCGKSPKIVLPSNISEKSQLSAGTSKLIDRCGTRNPYKVAQELGINIIYRNFEKQRGAYKVILKNRFVFLKNGMHPVIGQIVLWHEIGHDVLHRKEAITAGGFKEFNIFDMRENRMEYEANIFASQASLPDDAILEYIENGYDIQQIARAMNSDINLIALKVDTLIAQGYHLRKQEHRNDFLKYNHKM